LKSLFLRGGSIIQRFIYCIFYVYEKKTLERGTHQIRNKKIKPGNQMEKTGQMSVKNRTKKS
jgi:hypothetical protein